LLCDYSGPQYLYRVVIFRRLPNLFVRSTFFSLRRTVVRLIRKMYPFLDLEQPAKDYTVEGNSSNSYIQFNSSGALFSPCGVQYYASSEKCTPSSTLNNLQKITLLRVTARIRISNSIRQELIFLLAAYSTTPHPKNVPLPRP
jgi:hypothetical protein